VHGYIPPQEYNTLDKYQEYVDYLASNGFVVYKIDLRGHGDSEGKPSSAYYGSDYVIDVLNAYKTLKKTDYVENVGLWGHSMGGNLVFRTMIVEQDIAATVVWAGAVFTYTDFADFQIEDNSYQRPDNQSERAQERRQLYEIHGRFDPQSSFWRKVIPTNYLEDVNTALQLHHAVNDQVVDIRYSRNIAAILNGSDIDVQFYEYQNGGHNITGGSFSSAMERTAVFFKEKLK
jgi:dipeptidyl aminopeptidase/acylaminoacyl peptidase